MTREPEERCAIRRCREMPAITYLGIRICDRHWNAFADRSEQEFRDAVAENKVGQEATCDRGA